VDEVPAILDLLRPLAGQPHLLVGDLNALCPGDPVGTPPRGEEKRGDALPGAPRRAIRLILDAGYVDCYRSLHPETPGYTYPSHALWLRLDYIFASPPMAARLYACDVVMGEEAERASDHFPIWAQLANTSEKTDSVNGPVAMRPSLTRRP
jgi:exonuclease III